MRIWTAFVVGLFIGGSLGFFCACLLACSREKSFWVKQIKGGEE